jgi:hypothetical protein
MPKILDNTKLIRYKNGYKNFTWVILWKKYKTSFPPDLYSYTGCLKKDAMEIQQAVVHHKRG